MQPTVLSLEAEFLDWTALWVSLQLGLVSVIFLAPLSMFLAYLLAFGRFRFKRIFEALVVLPLVLPPTVLGFYLLALFSPQGWIGALWRSVFGQSLAFSFEGLVIASVIANIPFAVQPLQRAFEAIPRDVRDAAACCGMNPFVRFREIDLPLAWPGLATGMILSFAHTLGEFGVVLMVGGSIQGETRTLSIAIYDAAQSFDEKGAAIMAAVLMVISMIAVFSVMGIGRNKRQPPR